ncbi:MAG: glycosyltransferase family 2 protein [Fibrobacteraceae bacterium]|nr:glycosyltransferase family 2 protein [Fibrobacteraceae bacterium]
MGAAENQSFCAVVPVYRHEEASRHVAEALSKANIHVVLVDDGNTPEGHAILENIAAQVPNTHLVTNKVNMGKGGAVISGLKAAFAMGFTHAFQIDADGQHDLNAIPFFIKASRKHPQNVISAFPQYDGSVPKAREQGRKITNFWVYVETLSTEIPDTMCGCRVYPLHTVLPIANKIKNYRMGFDIEIMVRISWAGIKMNFYPIKVTYPEDGVSNFRVLHDNLAISATHTKLVCGMLLRLPKLLLRKIRPKK